MQAYYDAANNLEGLSILQELTAFSKERLDRAQSNFEFGRGSKLEVLNAEVDYQRDLTNETNARSNYGTSLRSINMLLGREPVEIRFDVESGVEYTLTASKESLMEEAEARNASLKLIESNVTALDYDIKLLNALTRPVISFNTSYDYGLQDFGDGGFFAQQRSNGLGAGLGLAWSVYDGGRIRDSKQTVKIQLEGNQLEQEQTRLMIQSQVESLYDQYQNALRLVDIESKNVEATTLAFDRSKEEYDLGRIGQIEFRQAQMNLLNAQLNESSSRYNAKSLEIQILNVAGKILDEETRF